MQAGETTRSVASVEPIPAGDIRLSEHRADPVEAIGQAPSKRAGGIRHHQAPHARAPPAAECAAGAVSSLPTKTSWALMRPSLGRRMSPPSYPDEQVTCHDHGCSSKFARARGTGAHVRHGPWTPIAPGFAWRRDRRAQHARVPPDPTRTDVPSKDARPRPPRRRLGSNDGEIPPPRLRAPHENIPQTASRRDTRGLGRG